jgi:hypothetical protein
VTTKNLSFLIVGCVLWQIDSANDNCHYDVRENKSKDVSEEAHVEPEHNYQEIVNHVASGRLDKVLTTVSIVIVTQR